VVDGEEKAGIAVDASERMFGDVRSEEADCKGTKVDEGTHGKSGLSLASPSANSQNPKVVYVMYKDHIVFKNVQNPLAEAMIRETLGWVRKENEELMLIEHDRPTLQGCCGFNGVVILKRCIISIVEVPLQSISNNPLNYQGAKQVSEYALQTKKRKTLKNRRDEKYKR
jgi:hypothetical protein